MGEIKYVFTEEQQEQPPKRRRGRPKKSEAEKLKKRPQLYTEDLADEICMWLASGKSLARYCKIDGNVSYATIQRWIWKGHKWYREDFHKRYEEARRQQAQFMIDQIVDIADDGTNDFIELTAKDGKKTYRLDAEHLGRSKLRVDTRQWIAKNLLPKIYGDKVGLKVDEESGPITLKVVYEKQKPMQNNAGE